MTRSLRRMTTFYFSNQPPLAATRKGIMSKRVSEVERVRKYFQLAPIAEARLFLKILCADAGLTVSEPRFKKAESKAHSRSQEKRIAALTNSDSAAMQQDAKRDA